MSTANDSPVRIVRDFLLLAALLGGMNYGLAREDAGWLELNPTPWLLLPLLLGARYGLGAGAVAGLLTASGIALIRAHLLEVEPWEWITQHRYPLTSLALAGVLAGELNHLLRGDLLRQRRHGADLDDQLARLKSELELTRETRHDLQKQLALHNAPLACLDHELQKLVQLSNDDWLGSLLRLLQQLAGVSSAGIYVLRDGTLRLLAAHNPTPPLADAIPLEHSALGAKALEDMAVTALSDPLEISPSRPFLAAVPWGDGAERGVLLIHDMPLESFDWRNLARIELILHWSHAVRAHMTGLTGHNVRKLLPLEDFMLALAQALETEQVHCLPSTVLRFDFAQGDTAADGKRGLLATLPATALASRLPAGSIVALLPFAGDSAAESTLQTVKEQHPVVRCSQYLVAGPANLEAVWSRILEA